LKFKTTTRELKKHISAVSRAVDVKPTTPALQGVYMKALGEFCEFVGSDLDLVIKSRLKMEVLVDGECLINARVLSDVVRKLPSGDVIVSDVGSEVKIEASKAEYSLRKLDHLTYPKALLEESFEQESSEKLNKVELFEALKKVGIAASPEGGKPILTGVYFDNTEENTTIVSTDSYRLAVNDINDLPIDDAGIISFRSLNETIKLFEEEEGSLFLNSTEREVHFFNENFYTSVRKLEGTFPEYKVLFPKENLFSIEVNKRDILNSLDRSTVVAEGFIPVTLKIVDENTLNIFSTNKDIGGGVEELDIKILGLEVGDITDFEISFNPNYLIQGIEVLDGETAFLRFSGNDKPAVIQGQEDSYKYLLMPVRTN
jgi:DNA polymerase-3 subunit beta